MPNLELVDDKKVTPADNGANSLWQAAYETVREHPGVTAAASAVAGAAIFVATRGKVASAAEHLSLRAVSALEVAPRQGILDMEMTQLMKAIPGKASVVNDGYFAPSFVASNHEMANHFTLLGVRPNRQYFWGIGDTPRDAVINGFHNWAQKNGYSGHIATLAETRLKLVKAGIAR